MKTLEKLGRLFTAPIRLLIIPPPVSKPIISYESRWMVKNAPNSLYAAKILLYLERLKWRRDFDRMIKRLIK